MLEAQAENPVVAATDGEITSSFQEASSWPTWLGWVALVLPVIMGTVILLKDDPGEYQVFVKDVAKPDQLFGLIFVTVLMTALFLALDFWLKPVPKPGSLGNRPLMIFGVVLLVWLIGFPAAYFTRSSGRRGPIGWISVLVVAYFVGSGYLAATWAESLALRPDSPQMKAMVSGLVKDQPFAWGIRGFEDFEEIGRDPVKDSIRCRCLAVSVEGKFEVYFNIEPDPQSWLAKRVRLSGIGPLPCGNPEILKMVRQVLTQSGGITELKTLKDFKETSWDRAKNTRMGMGSAVTPQGTFPVLVQVIGMGGDNYGFMVQAEIGALPH